MTPGRHSEPSQRAKEVARDLLEHLDAHLEKAGLRNAVLRFHLDGSDVILNQDEAMQWVMESVDAGFPRIGFHIEEKTRDSVLVNLAASDDPDSQYWP